MATPARIAAWLGALQALLPPGQAIAREAGAVATRLLEAIAARFADADDAAEGWTAQYDPLRATSMLPDWERLLGLPERCMVGVSLTLADRQRLAAQRLVELGGQSRAYFIEIARQLGEPGVTITEFSQFNVDSACTQALYSQADEFTWRVNIPRPAADVRLMACENDCTSALQSYRPSLAECPITERKPAHTAVIFAYAG